MLELHSIAAHIKLECRILGELSAVLRDEQRALVRGEIESLTSYADPKAKLLMELSQCADQRARLLASHGLAADAAGMNQLLHMLPADAEGAAAAVNEWQRLLDDTRIAKQLNEINGSLIASRMRGTQQALNALLGAARIPGTYGADGSTLGVHSAHRLAVA